jgi:hypothetical protein
MSMSSLRILGAVATPPSHWERDGRAGRDGRDDGRDGRDGRRRRRNRSRSWERDDCW